MYSHMTYDNFYNENKKGGMIISINNKQFSRHDQPVHAVLPSMMMPGGVRQGPVAVVRELPWYALVAVGEWLHH